MKQKHLLIAGAIALAAAQSLNAQNHFPPPGGNCGVNGFSNTQQPNFNLQVHGTSDWTGADPRIEEGNPTPVPVNYGKTSRFGMTNSSIGKLATDGMEFRMSEKNFYMTNQEGGGDLTIFAGGIMTFKGESQNIYTGGTLFSINDESARFNVWGGNRHALNVRTTNEKANGVAVQSHRLGNALIVFSDNAYPNFKVSGYGETFARKLSVSGLFSNGDNAIEVFDIGGVTRNFKVTGTGEVFARKYTTTLSNIPDYVFEPSYKLLSFDELRSYIETNKHLPNIPSAKEIEANDSQVDLGEMNRLLLEKVEEMSLYILQLEQRLKAVEEQK